MASVRVGVTLASLAAPIAASAQDAPAEPPPTSLEQTLADHVCSTVPASDPADDTHEQCVSLQFHALRSEFGYNLSRLSSSERSRVDATCSRLRRPENLDPYLNCVTSFLVAAREQRRGADGIAPAGLGEVTFGVPSIPARPPAPPPSHTRAILIVATIVGVCALAGAGAVFVLRTRKREPKPAAKVCQKCGEPLNAAGDLCSTCRHEAGIAAKQAIAERAAEERAEQERQRIEREQLEERRRQLEQQVAEAQRQEELRLQEEARRQADVARRQAEAPIPPLPVVAAIGADDDGESAGEFDPYEILGVSRDASRQEIDRAYCTAASKYDETQVAHLGDAVQAHYRNKAQAIERAYRTLVGTAA